MWTEQEKEILTNNYSNTALVELCSLIPSKGKRSIYEMARRLGLKKERIRIDCFAEISLESSYWGGFLAADGCIGDNNSLQVKLQGRDHKHLEKLNTFLGRSKPISLYTRDTNKGKDFLTSHLQTVSQPVCKDLELNFNIKPRKTQNYNPPYWLSGDLALAFIKGYIDGDGHICLPSNSKFSRLEIIGTWELVSWIRTIVNFKYGYLKRNHSLCIRRHISEDQYVYQVGGPQGDTFLRYLRTLETPFLERKWIPLDKELVPSSSNGGC